ncbi:MAG: MFS transporter [Anaerolineae bacterium]|nr:MFS transporter [Anaerolineae bacterium]
MKNLILLVCIGFAVFMSAGTVGPISSLYYESLGANYALIGLLGTTTWTGSILFSYLWGRASDYFGRRKPFLVIGLVVLSVSYALTALVQRYEWLFPLRIIAAAAQAAYGTTSLALMGDLLEHRTKQRGRDMGIYRGLCSLGFGIMAFVSGGLADWLSLSFPFVLSALFLGVAVLFALAISEPVPDEQMRGLVGWRQFTRLISVSFKAVWGQTLSYRVRARSGGAVLLPGQLPLTPLLVSAFLWSLVTGAVYAVWANYMVGQIGYTRAAMSQLWSLASSSELVLMIAAGWLSDRMGRLPMLSLGFVAWTLVFVGYVLAPGMPWILAVQLVRGFAYSAFTATAMTYAAEVRGREQRGWVSGLYSSANGIGSILGASMGGGLTQWLGFVPMIEINAMLIFGGAVYLGVEAVRHRRGVRLAQEGTKKEP